MMESVIEQIDDILDIKCEALYFHDRLLGSSPAAYPELERQFENLVERFYREHGGLITPRQYHTARNNYEYFMVLLEQVINTYREQGAMMRQNSGEGR